MSGIDLEKYMESYGDDILSFCKYLTRNKEEAEDLCQDTFVRGYELSGRIKDETHIKGFFLSIAIQLWKNKRRKLAWRQRIFNDQIIPQAASDTRIVADEDTPEQKVIEREQAAIIRKCVDALSEKKRVVVLLFYTEGLTEAEIAEVLRLPIGTVKSRLHSARAELAGMLSTKL